MINFIRYELELMHSRALDINGLEDGDGGVYRYSLIWSIYPVYSPFVFILYFFVKLKKYNLNSSIFRTHWLGLVKLCEVHLVLLLAEILFLCPSVRPIILEIYLIKYTGPRRVEGRLAFWYNLLHLFANLILEVKF